MANEQRSMGLPGLIKAYIGRNKIEGGWEEDLEQCHTIYRSLTSMCELTPAKNLKGVNIIIKEDAQYLFTYQSRAFTTYNQAIHAFSNC